MLVGATTLEFKRFGEERYTKMREFGFQAVDYSIGDTELPEYTLSDNELEAFIVSEKKKIEDAGLIISQVHGPWRWPCQDNTEEDRAERMEKMKRSIKICALLGCKHWVIHPIMPYGTYEKKDAEKAKLTYDMNIKFMSQLLEFAKAHNVIICLENMPMPDFSLGSPQDTLRFVKEMNDDNFKICFDTGHATMFGYKSVGEHVRELGDYIKVFHIHDNNGWADIHQLPYFGVIDWGDFSKALKDIDFKGIFSLETPSCPNMCDEDYEKLNRMKFDMAQRVINL